MANDTQFDPNSLTVINTPSGSITGNNSITGNTFTLSGASGSNMQFGTTATSVLSTNNSQSLTLGSTFSTTRQNDCSFVGKDKEVRVLEDYVELIGPDSILNGGIIEEWHKEYARGYGSFKTQWQDNREELSLTDYPLNSSCSKPAGTAMAAIACPPLEPGTYADNVNKDAQGKFEARMIKAQEDATTINVSKIDSIYADLTTNLQNLYAARTGVTV